MVAASSAAAAAILGFYALQRSRSARVALSVLAPVVATTGLVLGGLLSSAVAVAVVMLWLQPSRDWFDGVTPSPAPERRPDPAPTPDREPPSPWRRRRRRARPRRRPEPRPYTGFGNAHADPGRPGAGRTSAAAAVRRRTPERTRTAARAVLWAAVLTWAMSGLMAGGMVMATVVIGLSPEPRHGRGEAARADDGRRHHRGHAPRHDDRDGRHRGAVVRRSGGLRLVRVPPRSLGAGGPDDLGGGRRGLLPAGRGGRQLPAAGAAGGVRGHGLAAAAPRGARLVRLHVERSEP